MFFGALECLPVYKLLFRLQAYVWLLAIYLARCAVRIYDKLTVSRTNRLLRQALKSE